MADWQNVATPDAGGMVRSDPFGSLAQGMNVAVSMRQLNEDNEKAELLRQISESDMSEMDKLRAYGEIDPATAADYARYLKATTEAERALDPFFIDLERRTAEANAKFAENRALKELSHAGAYDAQANKYNAEANRTDNLARIESAESEQALQANIPMGERRYWDERGLAERKKGNKYATDAAGQRMVDESVVGINVAKQKREENLTVEDTLMGTAARGTEYAKQNKLNLEAQGTFAVRMAEAEGILEKSRLEGELNTAIIENRNREAESVILAREGETNRESALNWAEIAKTAAGTQLIKEQKKQLIRDSALGRALEITESGAVVATERGRLQSLNVQDVLAANESESKIETDKKNREKIDAQIEGLISAAEDAANLTDANREILKAKLEVALEEVKTQEGKTAVQKAIEKLNEARATATTDKAASIVSLNEKKAEVLGDKSTAQIAVYNEQAKAISAKSFSDSLIGALNQAQIAAVTEGKINEFAAKHANLLAEGEFKQEKYAADLNLLLDQAEMNDVQKEAARQAMELALEESVVKLNTMLDESRATVAKTEAQTLAVKTESEAQVNLLEEELINLTNERYRENMMGSLERAKIQGDIQADILRVAEEMEQLRRKGEITDEEHSAQMEEYFKTLQLGTVKISQVRQAMRIAQKESDSKIEINEEIAEARRLLLGGQLDSVKSATVQSNMNAIQKREHERNVQALVEAGMTEENATQISLNKHLLDKAKYDAQTVEKELKKLGVDLQISEANLEALPALLKANQDIKEQELAEATADAEAAVFQQEQEEQKVFQERIETQLADSQHRLAVANEAVEMINLAPEIRTHLLDLLQRTEDGDARYTVVEDFMSRLTDGDPRNNPEGTPQRDFMEENRSMILAPFMDRDGVLDLSNAGIDRAKRSLAHAHETLSKKANLDKTRLENLTHEYNAFKEQLLNPGTPIELVLDMYMKAVGIDPAKQINAAKWQEKKLKQLRKMREGLLQAAVQEATGAEGDDGITIEESLIDLILRGGGS